MKPREPTPAEIARVMAALGRRTSPAKAKAAKANRAKGGGRKRGPQPWLALGITRQAWYARKRKERKA